MAGDNAEQRQLPPEVAAIRSRGYAVWVGEPMTPEFRARFDAERIPVLGVRQVRVWGLQVDDERELPGRERTLIPDEELWQVVIEACDGSHFEVNASFLAPAP